MHEQKQQQAFSLELKSLDSAGFFSGYASVFNIVDSQQDIILPGAFAKSLRERAGQVRLLWQHQMDEPIGYFEKLDEDHHGLFVQGRLLLEVRRAQEAYALIRSGAIDGLSIGYSPTQYDFDPKSGVRRIAELSLWEVSLVTFPANAAAGVTAVKQRDIPGWQKLALAEELDRAIGILRQV
jgi:uncharacterized protein